MRVNTDMNYCKVCRKPINPMADTVYMEGESLETLVGCHIHCKPRPQDRRRVRGTFYVGTNSVWYWADRPGVARLPALNKRSKEHAIPNMH